MLDLGLQCLGVFFIYQFFSFINIINQPLHFKECYVLEEKTLVSLESIHTNIYDGRFLPDESPFLINGKKYMEVYPQYCYKITKRN